MVNVGVGYSVDPEPRAQQLDLGALLNGYDIDAVTLVRPDIEALPEDAPDPAIRNRPIVLVAVALDEPGRDIRDGDHGPLRAGDQLGEDFQDLRFDEEPAVCDEIQLRVERHGAQL